MKRYWKITFACLVLLLACVLVIGCGNEAVDTDPGAALPETEAQETAHVHATTKGPVATKESTCIEHGHIQYRCDECNARYVEELPLGKHEYKTQFDATLGYEVVKCNGCGRLIHLDHEASEQLVTSLRSIGGFTLDAHSMLFGRCASCIGEV